MKTEEYIDKFLNIIFSKDKTALYVVLFMVFGLILRIIAAINLGVSADDMHFTVHAIDFIKSGKLVTYDQSAGLWYELTDAFYKVFGITQFGSRFASILFGTFTILVIYLLGKEFGGRKLGLIAAFLIAISPWHIKNTIAEMDVTTMFFVLTSALIFLYGLKDKKISRFVISGIFLGLAIYTKVYSLLFIPSFLVYMYIQNKNENNKQIYKLFLIFLLVAFIFAIPSLTHNYLLYKDKGYTDLLYARTLGIARNVSAQYYSWDASWNSKADWAGFFFGNSVNLPWSKMPSSIYALLFVFYGDPIIFILGILGLFLAFKSNRKLFSFSISFAIFVFLYLASIVMLSKHYLFLLLFLTIPAAFTIENLAKKIRLKHIFLILVFFSFIWLGYNNLSSMGNFYSTSAVEQMFSFKEGIPQNSLIIADSRIYRGEINWMLNGKNYVESGIFPDVYKISEESSGQKIVIPVYYIECERDDCGWGTIYQQPEFNQTMEKMAEFFREKSEIDQKIYSTDDSSSYFPWQSSKKGPYFRIYRVNVELNPGVFELIRKNQVWFLYPIGYDESIALIFDKYNANGFFDKALDILARFIIRVALIIALLSPLYLIYIARKK